MSLDTRGKIITIDEARALAPAAVAFVTHLEVLSASHVRKLEELAAGHQGKLFVILTDPRPPQVPPLVPIEARAELTAALRVVDYVIPSPDGAREALDAIHPARIVADEEEDRGRTRSLIEHVRSRSRI